MSARGNNPNDDWDVLILGFLDDRLSAVEQELVLRLLDDNASFQLRFASYALDQAELYEAPSPALIGSQRRSIRLTATQPERANPLHRRWIGVAAAVFVAAGVFALLANRSPLPESTVALPTLERAIGEVVVDGKLAKVGVPIEAGQRIHTRRPMSFAALRFADGTEIQLAGETVVTCEEQEQGKSVRVLAGNVSASVRPQKAGKPLVIRTPSATMEVLGTNLAVSASPERTRLNVATGAVKIKRNASPHSVVVKGGEFAVASATHALQSQRSASAPDEWSAAFTSGLPAGWEGKFVAGEKGRQGGSLRAIRIPAEKLYRIGSPNAWSEGLFRIYDDSYLTYRIKMDRPEWYHVILCVRDDHYKAPDGHPIHEHQELVDFTQIEPGEWRTVSVPISAFRLPTNTGQKFVDRPGDPPSAGTTAFHLLFATVEGDRGLEIDSIAVTRGQPKLDAVAENRAALAPIH